MELKLKTKKKNYTAQTFDLTFGVVDDTIKALSPETVDFSDKMALGKAILGAWKQVEPILLELFEGVTHEELRTVKISNIATIAQGIYNHMTGVLSGMGDGEKN
jgi:hypothetical protein